MKTTAYVIRIKPDASGTWGEYNEEGFPSLWEAQKALLRFGRMYPQFIYRIIKRTVTEEEV